MDSTSTEKDGYKRDKLIHWFNETDKYHRTDFLKEKKDGSGRDAESIRKELRERVAKGPSKGFDLDITKTNEMNKASE